MISTNEIQVLNIPDQVDHAALIVSPDSYVFPQLIYDFYFKLTQIYI